MPLRLYKTHTRFPLHLARVHYRRGFSHCVERRLAAGDDGGAFSAGEAIGQLLMPAANLPVFKERAKRGSHPRLPGRLTAALNFLRRRSVLGGESGQSAVDARGDLVCGRRAR